MKGYGAVETPLGMIYAAGENGFVTDVSFAPIPGAVKGNCPEAEHCLAQLGEYFRGLRREFTVPVRLQGTEFQKKVWDALMCIPYGQLRTYGQIAASLGAPSAARAVGSACGKNPVLILLPCHRVVGAGGPGGYAAGAERKRELLLLEKRVLEVG